MSDMNAIDTQNAVGIDTPPLSDAEAAAVLVMLLHEDQASRMLGQLSPAELQLLGQKMCALGEIGPEAICRAVDGFAARTQKLGIDAWGRTDRVHNLMRRAVGTVKADNLMERIAPDAPRPARWPSPNGLTRRPSCRWSRASIRRRLPCC
jgi:flagellar motor switch protein FliG